MSVFTTLAQTQEIANAVIDKVKKKGYALDADLASVAKSGAAADVSITDTDSNFEATDVEGALAELAEATAGGVESKTVYMTDASSGQTEFAKVYNIYQGANGSAISPDVSELVGTINVPKDMVVSAAELKTVTTADVPYAGAKVGDPYIDLTIANASSSHIYIPVKDLVDVYTAGNGLALNNGQFSVTINSSAANGLSVTGNGIELALATGTTAGAMSAADKAKLDDADVTAYTAGNGVAISNHEVSATVVAANGLSVGSKGIAMATATASTAGVGGSNGAMTAADKEKLDNADVTAYTAGNGIDVTGHAVSAVIDGTNANGLSVGASGIALAPATQSTAGALSAADKTKLDDFTIATAQQVEDAIAALDDL